ncbi:MAG: hypothetical protein IJG38_11490 [Thermoguttaceae bacterium]|nr:hypothetical protein [Thermoguttaceae bacterium]
MENNNLEELLVLYALGELEPDEASAVEEELQKRPELAAEVEKVRRADGLLSDVFALSDEAAQQAVVEESVKPKIADKSETSRRLARRFALASAALSLFFVLVALLYPQFVKNDVQVAMTTQETAEDKSVPMDAVTEDVKLEESAPETEEPVLKQAQEEAPLFALNAMDDADVAAEDVVEEADEAIPPEAPAEVEMEMVEADMDQADEVPAAPAYAPLNVPAPAAAAPEMEAEESAGLMRAAAPKSDGSEPEEAQAQYFMRNALYDIPGQKTPEGMAPIKGEVPPMKEELLQESTLGEMAVDQMNKRLDAQRKVNAESKGLGKKRSFEQYRQDRGAAAVLIQDSYAILRKCVLEDNRFPNPADVKVDQWLSHFGIAQPVKAAKSKSEATEDKDAQFVKAVNLFAAALSNPEPADVKAFEEVLNLLKDSVGDDPKRLEFRSIVEKTIEIKKRSE